MLPEATCLALKVVERGPRQDHDIRGLALLDALPEIGYVVDERDLVVGGGLEFWLSSSSVALMATVLMTLISAALTAAAVKPGSRMARPIAVATLRARLPDHGSPL
jgi:hypothetical protein